MAESRARPLSPHLQIYRPQLTSVLSFAHRLTGLILGTYAVALVAWLIAAAAGAQPYLFWDSGRGFDLRTIYASGWTVVVASTVLTSAAWIVGWVLVR